MAFQEVQMEKKDARTDWTAEQVAERFRLAALTAIRLPRVGPYGFPNPWGMLGLPTIDKFPDTSRTYRQLPPSPQDISEMLEVMKWVQCLDVPSRQMIWMRANRYEWQQIGRRFACDRNTASRRWNRCIELVTYHLNEKNNIDRNEGRSVSPAAYVHRLV